jgi:multisubunit Na+/H+ antiporter MnhB subunit
MGVEVLVLILIAFMFIGSLIATESKDLLSSVIAVGAVGFGLSVIDLLLGAPDLAITQVVVEVIALVLLIRVVLTRRETATETSSDALRVGVVLLATGVFLVAVFFAVGGFDRTVEETSEIAMVPASGMLPEFGEPVLANDPETHEVKPGVAKDYLEYTVSDPDPEKNRNTGAGNAVMGILLDYRAYDTLGEATVIFVSILGAYALLRHVGRKKSETPSGVEGEGSA